MTQSAAQHVREWRCVRSRRSRRMCSVSPVTSEHTLRHRCIRSGHADRSQGHPRIGPACSNFPLIGLGGPPVAAAVVAHTKKSEEGNMNDTADQLPDGPDAPLGVDTAINWGTSRRRFLSVAGLAVGAAAVGARGRGCGTAQTGGQQGTGEGGGPPRRGRRDPVRRRFPVGPAQQLQPVRRAPRLAHRRRPEPAHLRDRCSASTCWTVRSPAVWPRSCRSPTPTPSCCRCRTAPSGPTAAS